MGIVSPVSPLQPAPPWASVAKEARSNPASGTGFLAALSRLDAPEPGDADLSPKRAEAAEERNDDTLAGEDEEVSVPDDEKDEAELASAGSLQRHNNPQIVQAGATGSEAARQALQAGDGAGPEVAAAGPDGGEVDADPAGSGAGRVPAAFARADMSGQTGGPRPLDMDALSEDRAAPGSFVEGQASPDDATSVAPLTMAAARAAGLSGNTHASGASGAQDAVRLAGTGDSLSPRQAPDGARRESGEDSGSREGRQGAESQAPRADGSRLVPDGSVDGGNGHLFDMGPPRHQASWTAGPSGPGPGNARPGLPAPPADASMQARLQVEHGTVRLIVAPDELGTVEVTVRADAEGVALHLRGEREASVDLMRRHAAQLQRELAQEGLAGSRLSFSQGGQDGAEGREAGREMRPRRDAVRPAVPSAASTPLRFMAAGAGQVDLRL